jgi:hypothetical protein
MLGSFQPLNIQYPNTVQEMRGLFEPTKGEKKVNLSIAMPQRQSINPAELATPELDDLSLMQKSLKDNKDLPLDLQREVLKSLAPKTEVGKAVIQNLSNINIDDALKSLQNITGKSNPSDADFKALIYRVGGDDSPAGKAIRQKLKMAQAQQSSYDQDYAVQVKDALLKTDPIIEKKDYVNNNTRQVIAGREKMLEELRSIDPAWVKEYQARQLQKISRSGNAQPKIYYNKRTKESGTYSDALGWMNNGDEVVESKAENVSAIPGQKASAGVSKARLAGMYENNPEAATVGLGEAGIIPEKQEQPSFPKRIFNSLTGGENPPKVIFKEAEQPKKENKKTGILPKTKEYKKPW